MLTKREETAALASAIQAAAGATADLQADRISEELSDHANLLLAIRHFGIERFSGYLGNSWQGDFLIEKLERHVQQLNYLIQPKPVLDEEQARVMNAAWNRDIDKWRAVGGNVD